MHRFRHLRIAALVLLLASPMVGLLAGCGSGSAAGSARTVRDNPPDPGELTTEDVLRQEAKTRPRR